MEIELLAQAIATIKDITNTAKGHSELLKSIVERILEIERRLDNVEKITSR